MLPRTLNTPSANEWLKRGLLALGCGLVLALVFAPPLGAFAAWARLPEAQGMLEVRRGASVLLQAQSPGIEIPDTLHAVIRWRLLFPFLGYVLGLPAWALFGLAHAGAVLVLGYALSLLRARGAGWGLCAQAVVVLGAASWFFTSTGWLGYYDSWLAYGLLLVTFAGRAWPVWLACVWAPWVDERFVLAAPLALVCRFLLQTAEGDGAGDAGAGRKALLHQVAVPAALLALFVLVRLVLLPASKGTGLGSYLAAQNNLDAPFVVMGWGVWEGLRVGWVFVGAAVWLVWKDRGNAGAAWLVCGLIGTAAAGLVLAQDFSRSMTMLLPAALLGLVLAARRGAAWLPRSLAIGVPVALLLPAHHVMSDRVNPIYYIYHEIYVLANPPAALRPERFELNGIHLMEQGDNAGAEAQLTMAIRLSDNPVNPCKHRGLLRAGQGRWKEAREDFATMTRAEPDNPEGWFLCAQAAAAQGDAATARSELQRALSVAPAGWERRPDVERFRSRLGR